MTRNDSNSPRNGHTLRALDQMIGLLENEREALLKGDVSIITSLASDKEFIARTLGELASQKDLKSSTDREIVSLTRKVAKLTESNHQLLQQMYQHYQGMLELMLRMTGHGSTYDRHGSVGITYGPKSQAEFTA